MTYSLLIIVSLVLLNQEIIPILKNASIYWRALGMALFSGTLVWHSFKPENYWLGFFLVSILTLLTVLERKLKGKKSEMFFFVLVLITIASAYVLNFLL